MGTKYRRTIADIAYDIRRDWGNPVTPGSKRKGIYFGALPYLNAMAHLGTIHDKYFLDDARSIVLYFLSNATTYRGQRARELKAELKALLK